MKYVFCVLLIVCTCSVSHSQILSTKQCNNESVTTDSSFSQPNCNLATHNDLYKQTAEWKRYKTLSACGWTMLAIGPPLLVGGALGGSLSIDGGTKNKSFLYTTAIIVGGIFTVASIPLLISAYYNRHKAKRLEMSLSAMEMPKYIDKSGYVPTLKISINF